MVVPRVDSSQRVVNWLAAQWRIQTKKTKSDLKPANNYRNQKKQHDPDMPKYEHVINDTSVATAEIVTEKVIEKVYEIVEKRVVQAVGFMNERMLTLLDAEKTKVKKECMETSAHLIKEVKYDTSKRIHELHDEFLGINQDVADFRDALDDLEGQDGELERHGDALERHDEVLERQHVELETFALELKRIASILAKGTTTSTALSPDNVIWTVPSTGKRKFVFDSEAPVFVPFEDDMVFEENEGAICGEALLHELT